VDRNLILALFNGADEQMIIYRLYKNRIKKTGLSLESPVRFKNETDKKANGTGYNAQAL